MKTTIDCFIVKKSNVVPITPVPGLERPNPDPTSSAEVTAPTPVSPVRLSLTQQLRRRWLHLISSQSQSLPLPKSPKYMPFAKNCPSNFHDSGMIKRPTLCIAFIGKSRAKAWLGTVLFLSQHHPSDLKC